MRAEPSTAADLPFGMTDFEERIRADDAGEVRAAVLSRLAQIDRDIGAMVRRGLSPEEFRRAQALLSAVAAARDFLTIRK